MSGRNLDSNLFSLLASRTPFQIRLRHLAGDGVLRRSVTSTIDVGALRSFSNRPRISSKYPIYSKMSGQNLSPLLASQTPFVLRLPPLAGDGVLRLSVTSIICGGALRSFSSSVNRDYMIRGCRKGQMPTYRDLLHGRDYCHWLVVMEPPEMDSTRDDIIDFYIHTLAQVVGSLPDARLLIYSVSTKYYFAFGAKISESLAENIIGLRKVRWVVPDSYSDIKKKSYGGEPFINGEAVPYDPRYHEKWRRNNAEANKSLHLRNESEIFLKKHYLAKRSWLFGYNVSGSHG